MSQLLFTLPQGNYGPVTHFKSPTYTPQPGTSTININYSISAADLADPTKSLTIFSERSDDNGQTWQFVEGATWQGGALDKHGNPAGEPNDVFNAAPYVGQLMRLDITTAQTINMGAQIVTEP